MNDILDFFIQHWQLSSTFILAVGAYLLYEFMQKEATDHIGPNQVVELINREQAVVIDIRSEDEFVSGHILNAINIDAAQDTGFKKLNKYANKPIILVCSSGKRAAQCVTRLQQQGFGHLYTLAGGLESWTESGLPLVK